jgi:hypothetical protein
MRRSRALVLLLLAVKAAWITGRLSSVTVTLKIWLRADDYDFDLLVRMFAVGDTHFVRQGARRYLTNRELDELTESGEVPPSRQRRSCRKSTATPSYTTAHTTQLNLTSYTRCLVRMNREKFTDLASFGPCRLRRAPLKAARRGCGVLLSSPSLRSTPPNRFHTYHWGLPDPVQLDGRVLGVACRERSSASRSARGTAAGQFLVRLSRNWQLTDLNTSP